MIPIYYVSQKWYSWDCDVWHNRHLDLKIRVFTSTYGRAPLLCGGMLGAEEVPSAVLLVGLGVEDEAVVVAAGCLTPPPSLASTLRPLLAPPPNPKKLGADLEEWRMCSNETLKDLQRWGKGRG